jgi:hypothetical protein
VPNCGAESPIASSQRGGMSIVRTINTLNG